MERMEGLLKQLENLPGAKWVMTHPRLSAWVVLSVGMVGLLVIEARDVGLLATQWIALIVATVLVAGACIWIISWEDNDEAEAESGPTGEPAPKATDATE